MNLTFGLRLGDLKDKSWHFVCTVGGDHHRKRSRNFRGDFIQVLLLYNLHFIRILCSKSWNGSTVSAAFTQSSAESAVLCELRHSFRLEVPSVLDYAREKKPTGISIFYFSGKADKFLPYYVLKQITGAWISNQWNNPIQKLYQIFHPFKILYVISLPQPAVLLSASDTLWWRYWGHELWAVGPPPAVRQQ